MRLRFILLLLSLLFFADISFPQETIAQSNNFRDDFTDGTIDSSWRYHLPNLFQQSESGGYYTVFPNANTVWYQASEAGLTYKNVSGNFKVTVLAVPRKIGTVNSMFSDAIQYSGIMIRDPQSDVTGLQNYVFNVIGFNQIETKTNVNDVSTVISTFYPGYQAELRLCRVNQNYYTFHRPVGATSWTAYQTFTRSDIGSSVQVGMTTYAANASPDIEGRFDYIEVTPVSSAEECATDTPVSSPSPSPTVQPSPSASASPLPTPTPSPIPGDTNNDGTVSGADVMLLLQNWVQARTQPIDQYIDGKINSLDFGVIFSWWNN
jgi:hypothetical protein